MHGAVLEPASKADTVLLFGSPDLPMPDQDLQAKREPQHS